MLKGNVLVADSGSHTIRKVSPNGEVTSFAGMAGMAETVDGKGGKARLSIPWGMTFGSDGTLYVADSGSHFLRKITSDGQVSTLFKYDEKIRGGSYGLAMDKQGNFYFTSLGHIIVKVTPNGARDRSCR